LSVFLAFFAISVTHEPGGAKLAAERRKLSVLIGKMTKFEFWILRSPGSMEDNQRVTYAYTVSADVTGLLSV
jgi:hypothetical protein